MGDAATAVASADAVTEREAEHLAGGGGIDGGQKARQVVELARVTAARRTGGGEVVMSGPFSGVIASEKGAGSPGR